MTQALLIKQLLGTALSGATAEEIVYRDIRYSYRTLCERIGRLAGALLHLGVRRGDVVAVMDWDSQRYLECFFAIPMMGAVLQTVNIRLAPEQILFTLNHAGARVLFVHSDFLPLLASFEDRLEYARTYVLLTDQDAPAKSPVRWAAEYEALLRNAPVIEAFPDFDENTKATTFHTSGTTGLPKGVYFSHRQIVLHTLSFLCTLGLARRHACFDREDVYMPMTPMFHVHAWGLPYAATLAGVKQVYPGRYSAAGLLNLRRTEGVSFSHCVPTILQMLLSAPEAADVDLRGWKILVGGSKLTTGLARLALERGIDVFSAYGMSETGPLLTVAQLDGSRDMSAQLTLRTKAGRPAPLVELRVVEPDMSDVPRDGRSTGEIVARAPWLTAGYLNDPDASGGLWRGGYLHTGDVGYIDTGGNVQITDRVKDVIKSGGEWISSAEVEDVISRHPAVSEVAVIGVPDDKWGERPMALIVLAVDCKDASLAAEIRAHVGRCAQGGMLSVYAVPERIEFVDSLARTSVGKLDKKTLRARYAVADIAPIV